MEWSSIEIAEIVVSLARRSSNFPREQFSAFWLEKGRIAPGPREIRRENSRLVRDLKSGTPIRPFTLEIVNSTIMTILITIRKGRILHARGGRSWFESETDLINNANERTLRIELSGYAPRFKCVA